MSPLPPILAVELSVESILGIAAIAIAGAAAVIFAVWQKVKEKKTSVEERATAGYLQLYNVEKEQHRQTSEELARLRERLTYLNSRLDELADENRKLVTLNTKMQEDTRALRHTIGGLEQTVTSLRADKERLESENADLKDRLGRVTNSGK